MTYIKQCVFVLMLYIPQISEFVDLLNEYLPQKTCWFCLFSRLLLCGLFVSYQLSLNMFLIVSNFDVLNKQTALIEVDVCMYLNI
jgi:hypothetical protein